jgi:ketosteroid isomerase-like protein
MSQANVEIVRLATRLTNEGNLDASFRLLHPDIEWVIAQEHPDARTVTGHEALAEYQRDWHESLPDVRFELHRVLDIDDKVVGIGTVQGTGAGSGVDVRVPLAFVYTLRDGLIARVQEYLNPAEALEAVGLAG